MPDVAPPLAVGSVSVADVFTGDDKSPEFWQWRSKMTGMCLMNWAGQSTAQKAGLIAARVSGSASNVLWGHLTGEETESPYPTPMSVFDKLATTYGKKSATSDSVIADLTKIRQDGKRVQKYTEEFMAIATKGRLADETKRGLYYGNLAKRVRIGMVGREFDTLGSMIEAALEIDDLVDKPRPPPSQGTARGGRGGRGRGRGRGGFGARGAQERHTPEWMECWTCGEKGHRSNECPKKEGGAGSSTKGKARETTRQEDGSQEMPPMYDSRMGAKRTRTYTPSHSDFDIGDQF